jgi:hypothetical protein
MSMRRSMQAQLHSDVHHSSTQHKGGIRRSAVGRERPCAQQAQRFHYMKALRDIC